MLITIIILSVLLAIAALAAIKLFSVYLESTDYISYLENTLFDVNINMQTALSKLRDVDIKGAFENDDEVGDVFSSIKTIVLDLNDKIPQIEELPLQDDGEKKKK